MCFYYSKFGLPVWPLLTLNCMFGYCKYMFVLDKELRENCVAHARMNEVGFQGANVLLLGRIGLSWAELNTNCLGHPGFLLVHPVVFQNTENVLMGIFGYK